MRFRCFLVVLAFAVSSYLRSEEFVDDFSAGGLSTNTANAGAADPADGHMRPDEISDAGLAHFQAFSQAGRDLADLHPYYETVDKHPSPSTPTRRPSTASPPPTIA